MADSSSEARRRESASLSYLPDASEEVAATADLSASVEGTAVKLHSQVLGAGNQVLRSAFATCGGDAAAQAAAVMQAFHGHKLADVQLFLRLMYDPTLAEDISSTLAQDWQGTLELADKLDAPAVLRACDRHLARVLGTTSATALDAKWQEWLLLADRLNMTRLVGQCVHPVVRTMLGSGSAPRQVLPTLAPLSKRTFQLIAEANIYAGSHTGAYQYVPSASQTAKWAAPGDLFS